jgi:N-acetylmuramoyl-L-alanine amidase/Ni/Co efflux regulator RcnB
MAKIGLDYGHGNNTFPPNKGVYVNGVGYAEHDFNAKLGLKIKKLLVENGHEVIEGQPAYGREVGLTTRTNLYNREKVDLVISIHANASGDNGADGRCAFYWHTSSKGKRAAELIIDEIKDAGYDTHGNGLHASKRGSWTDLHITRETNAPAVLTENGFMTNDEPGTNDDFELIFGSKQEEYTDDIARAHVRAIQRYFGESFKDTNTKVKEKPASGGSKPSSKGVEWVGTDLKGERVESIYQGSEGLNFYDGPRWDNPSGTFGYGEGWIIDNKYLVDGSPQYRVQNSNGDLYYITASPKYVSVGGTSSSSSGSSSGSSSTFTVGGKATIKNSAKTYATGESIPSRYKGKTYTIQQVKSDRVLLKELYSWVRKSDLVGGGSSGGSSSSSSYSVGDTVKIKSSARTYATGETIPSRYKNKSYTIQQVKSDRVLLKELYSWVRKSDVY